jgi:hypothetical protein
MEFKTRYNYLIVIGRIVLSIFFAATAVLLLYVIGDHTQKEDAKGIEIFFASIFTLIMIYLCYHFLSILVIQSYNFELRNTSLIKTSVFTRKQKTYQIAEIKGFSTSNYPLKIWNFKSIILYLNSGEKFELPQFLYFNFEEIGSQLTSNSIYELGHETYKWKFFDSRHYKYE